MGKGEIACYKQFLLFPQCFQKACFPGASKGVIVWEWVKYFNFVVCKCFQFGPVNNSVVWQWVKYDRKKKVGRRKKSLTPAFSPFPKLFAKASFLRVIKSRYHVVKSRCYYTPTKPMFSGVYWNHPVCPSVYKLLTSVKRWRRYWFTFSDSSSFWTVEVSPELW